MALEKFSAPEIQRVPLDSLLLQMISMGLPDARKFPFIEPPPSKSVESSILSLKEHVSLFFYYFFHFFQSILKRFEKTVKILLGFTNTLFTIYNIFFFVLCTLYVGSQKIPWRCKKEMPER